MKKIVPFTKELMFKTRIGEITSIALDNTLVLDSQSVSGEFIISGTYKMLEGSELETEFKYNIPVDITIDNKYETSACNISIDDFSYEIINEEKLKVNISVMLDDLDIKEDKIEKVEVVVDDREFDILDEVESDISELENLVSEEKPKEIINNININYKTENTNQEDLFNNIEDTKEYSIYRVYTLKEDDTLDVIYEKFETCKEILSEYNDLDNLMIGSKIIIPSSDE